jgi:hypothetical protein
MYQLRGRWWLGGTDESEESECHVTVSDDGGAIAISLKSVESADESTGPIAKSLFSATVGLDKNRIEKSRKSFETVGM